MTSRTSRLSRLSSLALASLLSLAMSAAWAQGSGAGSGGQSPTTAQPGAGTRSTPKAKLARADRRFIEEAASSGMMEVQAAQLAATRSTDRAVKSYAATLAEQQGAANNELMQLAASLGLELPAALQRSARHELERLGKRTGAEFDREFVREIGIKEHERDIRRFQKASKDVKEPQLKAWIDRTLPMLQQHLAEAQKLPQAGSESAASMRNQQQRMGAGQGGYPSGSGPSGSGPSGTSGTGTGTYPGAPYGGPAGGISR